MRIVGTFDRRGQNDVVRSVCELFEGEVRAPKVIDRRVAPMYGYAAVHVIVFPEGTPIEIQIRTAWQHEWAELFEKLADLVGRGIRYGEPPLADPRSPSDEYDLWVAIVALARAIADAIAEVEVGEVLTVGDPQLDAHRQMVDKLLITFRGAVEHLQKR